MHQALTPLPASSRDLLSAFEVMKKEWRGRNEALRVEDWLACLSPRPPTSIFSAEKYPLIYQALACIYYEQERLMLQFMNEVDQSLSARVHATIASNNHYLATSSISDLVTRVIRDLEVNIQRQQLHFSAALASEGYVSPLNRPRVVYQFQDMIPFAQGFEEAVNRIIT